MPEAILRPIKAKKIVILALLLVIITATGLIFNHFHQSQAALAESRDSLTATGTIEAKTVDTSFKIGGKISKLLVGEGAKIALGQELATLEDTEVSAKLAQARGAYEAAQATSQVASNTIPLTSQQVDAKIAQAEAGVEQARAGVEQARAALDQAKQVYDRMTALHHSGALSDQDYDTATNNYNGAVGKLQQAQGALIQAQGVLAEAQSGRQQVAVVQSQYDAAVGQSNQAAGAVQEAQDALNDTQLKSPITGYITQKYLEQGELVNAGTPVFEITDLAHTYVKVFIDEEKIGRVHLNQTANVTVDAFPGKIFKGKVVWINDAGDFAVKKAVNEQYNHDIRSFEVKIDLPNPNLQLKTGMTARAQILEG